jgi:hypothetical protein
MLAATASAQASTVGTVRLDLASRATIASPTWTAAHNSVVILQAWDTADLYALKAANPAVKVLMYQNASGASSGSSWNGIYPSGVSYDQALANGWLLKNTSGSTFTFNGYNWLYAADIGAPGYQDAWASNVLQELQAAPWDGVFMDDVNPTIKWHYDVTSVAEYPSDAEYGQAMGSFVANVGPKIMAAGKLAIANLGAWSSYTSVDDSWLQHLSGGMDESFVKWGQTAGTGYADPATWATQLGEVQYTESLGKMFIGTTGSSSSDTSAAIYGYATTLLGSMGNSVFYMGDEAADPTDFPEYYYQLGQPTSAQTAGSNGVHKRVFSDGLVLVNPTMSAVTVSLGGTYTGSGLTRVTTARMAPQTGLVLVRVSGSQSAKTVVITHAARAHAAERQRPRSYSDGHFGASDKVGHARRAVRTGVSA